MPFAGRGAGLVLTRAPARARRSVRSASPMDPLSSRSCRSHRRCRDCVRRRVVGHLRIGRARGQGSGDRGAAVPASRRRRACRRAPRAGRPSPAAPCRRPVAPASNPSPSSRDRELEVPVGLARAATVGARSRSRVLRDVLQGLEARRSRRPPRPPAGSGRRRRPRPRPGTGALRACASSAAAEPLVREQRRVDPAREVAQVLERRRRVAPAARRASPSTRVRVPLDRASASRSFTASATSCCCAPSWMLRSSLRARVLGGDEPAARIAEVLDRPTLRSTSRPGPRGPRPASRAVRPSGRSPASSPTVRPAPRPGAGPASTTVVGRPALGRVDRPGRDDAARVVRRRATRARARRRRPPPAPGPSAAARRRPRTSRRGCSPNSVSTS